MWNYALSCESPEKCVCMLPASGGGRLELIDSLALASPDSYCFTNPVTASLTMPVLLLSRLRNQCFFNEEELIFFISAMLEIILCESHDKIRSTEFRSSTFYQ